MIGTLKSRYFEVLVDYLYCERSIKAMCVNREYVLHLQNVVVGEPTVHIDHFISVGVYEVA
jgi:hypothetical protein